MQVAYFEDAQADQFRPLSWLPPVFELVCGQSGLRERVNRFLAPSQWGAFIRPWLVEAYQEEHSSAQLNRVEWLRARPTLLLNGRWLPDLDQLRHLKSGDAVWMDRTLVGLVLDPADVALLDVADIALSAKKLAQSRREIAASGSLIQYPWDLVHWNGQQLEQDFRTRPHGPSKVTLGSQVAALGRDEDVLHRPRCPDRSVRGD